MNRFVCVILLIALVVSGCSVGNRGEPAEPPPTSTTAPSADPAATMASSVDGTPTLFTSWSPPSAASSATVQAEGVVVELDRVHVSAPAGVAALDTSLAVSTPTEPALPGADEFSSLAGNPVSVSLGDAQQPQQPVTIVFDLAGTDLAANVSEESPLGVASRTEGSDVIELLPSTWDAEAQTLTVVTSHLSKFWPFRFDASKLFQPVIDTLLTTWGLRYPAPDCFGKSLTIGGATYSVGSVPNQVVWPCLTQQAGQIALEIHSNSALPWRARTSPSTSGAVGTLEVSGLVIAELYNLIFSRYAAVESVVVPGGNTSFLFDPAQPPVLAAVQAEAGLYLAAILVFGVELALEMFHIRLNLLEDAATLNCVVGVVETVTADDLLSKLQHFISATLSCLQVAVEGVATIVLSILTTGVGLLVAAIHGIIAKLTGANDAVFSVVREGSPLGTLTGFWGRRQTYLDINPDGTGSLTLNSGCCVGVTYELEFDFQAEPITATILSRSFLETDGFAPFPEDRAVNPGDVIVFRQEQGEWGALLVLTIPTSDQSVVREDLTLCREEVLKAHGDCVPFE